MWLYKNRELKKIPEGYVGFVYLIQNLLNNKIYIGKKLFNSTRRAKIGVREKAETKTRKKYKVIVKDSGWQNYNSSCKELQDDIKKFGEDNFVKQIIEFCSNKRELTYKEVVWQFKHQVLEANSYNSNIMGKFFRKK